MGILNFLLLLLIISCSSGQDSSSAANAPRGLSEPQILVNEPPVAGINQVTLTHEIQSGDLNWSIKISSGETIDGSLDDRCEFEVLPTGSQERVRFKDNLTTPFCSDFEVDPTSTIDNIIINTRGEDLEVCLNDNCKKIN